MECVTFEVLAKKAIRLKSHRFLPLRLLHPTHISSSRTHPATTHAMVKFPVVVEVSRIDQRTLARSTSVSMAR